MAPRLARLILMVRDVRRSTEFFKDGLRLLVETESASHARLIAGGNKPAVAIDLTLAQR